MAQINRRSSPLIAPMLTAVPRTHRQIMDQLKTHEQALERLTAAQDDLLAESKARLSPATMLTLARQNCGGRVYLRWRWRYGSRGFFDLIDHLHQFEPELHSELLAFEDVRQSINYATSIEQHAYSRLHEFKAHQARLRPLRSRSKRPTSRSGSTRFSNQTNL